MVVYELFYLRVVAVQRHGHVRQLGVGQQGVGNGFPTGVEVFGNFGDLLVTTASQDCIKIIKARGFGIKRRSKSVLRAKTHKFL